MEHSGGTAMEYMGVLCNMTMDLVLLAITWRRTWATRRLALELSNERRSHIVSHVLFDDGENISTMILCTQYALLTHLF